MIDILHRYTKTILYHSETAQTIADAVVEARQSNADLRGADLMDTDLTSANLRYANLRGTVLPDDYRIASLCFGRWCITITPADTQIGCERHPNEQWLGWAADALEIAAMHPNATAWWTQHREAVRAVIRDVMGNQKTEVAR